MNVVLLTPALTEGDAVSNDVFGMARTLRAMGHRVALSVRWSSPPIRPVDPLSCSISPGRQGSSGADVRRGEGAWRAGTRHGRLEKHHARL